MGLTKTDYVRGMQCPKMLWLDRHKPEAREIPAEVRCRMDHGNDFGDRLMGVFGPYIEVQEYYPGTKHPDKEKMAAKTAELIAAGTKIICEAAFMDAAGNYCAVDILRWDEETECYDVYEVKNSPRVSDQFIMDAAFQAHLVRKTGLPIGRVFIIFHGDEPYDLEEVTQTVEMYSSWIEENLERLSQIKDQAEEYHCDTGVQCACPYECWYFGYCRELARKDNHLP